MYDQNYHSLIKTALELYIKYNLDIQRDNLWEYAMSFATKEDIDPDQFQEFDLIFRLNGLDIKQFAHDLKIVLEKSDFKKNTLRLIGVRDSCKTLLANCIVAPFIACRGNNHCSESEFYLSNYLCKSIIKVDELYVTVATAEDMKSVLAGEPIDISKKFNDQQLMCRTPVIVTGNHRKLGRGHLPPLDENALDSRCFIYRFPTAYKPKVKLTFSQFYKYLDCYINYYTTYVPVPVPINKELI